MVEIIQEVSHGVMLLVTRPEYELPTRFVSAWAQEVIDVAKSKSVDVIELPPSRSNRATLESYLLKQKPRLVMFNGHGSEDAIYGQDDEALITAGQNEYLLKSKIVYAVACDSGKTLAIAAVQSGASAYIGYERVFVFTASQEFSHRPLEDKRAARFFKASNQVMISLLKGHNVVSSVEKAKNMFSDAYKKLLTSTADPDDKMDAQLLWWNERNLVALGDGSEVM